jgi:hypothetical protein
MNGTMIVSAIIIFFIISGLVSFVNDLQEDVNQKSSYTKEETTHYIIDAAGESVLVLTGLSSSEKKVSWNASTVKEEMLALFPNFIEMKSLIDEKVEEEGSFKKMLLDNLSNVEESYIGGEINGQSAKASLSNF